MQRLEVLRDIEGHARPRAAFLVDQTPDDTSGRLERQPDRVGLVTLEQEQGPSGLICAFRPGWPAGFRAWGERL